MTGSQRPQVGLSTHRWLYLVSLAIAIVVAAATALLGQPYDEQLRLARDPLRTHAASGQIAIVEIDARSLAQVGRWPWPRHLHGELIDRLNALGANLIAFDVDLSDASSTDEDRAMAAALERAGGGVVLPTFRQRASSLGDDYAENIPIAPLRAHAFLGSVNVQPDADGMLRRYAYGTRTAGSARPSIGALLAGAKGQIDKDFRVDGAIDPATIPRFSAIDVLRGRIKPEAVKGKSVLIGATAIEMGDRYIVPGRGILPGVVVQVMAAETLLQKTALPELGPVLPLMLASGAIIFGMWRKRTTMDMPGTIVAGIIVFFLPLALEVAKVATVDVVPAMMLLSINGVLASGISARRTFIARRLVNTATGLPNARALEQLVKRHGHVTIVTASLLRFEELEAILVGGDLKNVIRQVVARLTLGFPGSRIHWIGPGTLAWATSVDDIEDIEHYVEATAALFRAPVALGHRAVLVTPTYGISSGAGGDVGQIVAEARYAASQAQIDGRRMVVHSDAATSAADRSITLLADMEAALERDEIHVEFQPKWSTLEKRIVGAEALVRWNHPVFGRVSPDEFIPLFEDNGQMRALTARVTQLCFDTVRDWHARRIDMTIAINISAGLLDDKVFTTALIDDLKRLDRLARNITLEVTESAAVSSADTAVTALAAFRSLGASVSIDDYGTGHATLAYLKSFPADEIKIDKSFVTNMLASNSDQIVVRSTIELAHELGFKVVAEGAEDEACVARLTKFQCDTIQGWAIGKPQSAAALVALWQQSQTERAA